MNVKELLEVRAKIAKKRPEFKFQDSYKHPGIKTSWGKPKGSQSKIRKCYYGKPSLVRKGYRGPAAVRGLDRSGLVMIRVFCIKDLENMNPTIQGVIIASVGDKKKKDILQECKKKNFKVLNVKDVDAEISKITQKVAQRKESKVMKEKAKTERKVEKKKPLEEKVETDKDEKDKRVQERKEMEKVLTKR